MRKKHELIQVIDMPQTTVIYLFQWKIVWSVRVNTDEIYTSMFHKPLSLFGRGYTFRYRLFSIFELCHRFTLQQENRGYMGRKPDN